MYLDNSYVGSFTQQQSQIQAWHVDHHKFFCFSVGTASNLVDNCEIIYHNHRYYTLTSTLLHRVPTLPVVEDSG